MLNHLSIFLLIPFSARKVSSVFAAFTFIIIFLFRAPLRTRFADYGLSVSIVMLKWIMVINGVKERWKQAWHSSSTLPSSSKCSLHLHRHETPPSFCWISLLNLLWRSWAAGGVQGESTSTLQSSTNYNHSQAVFCVLVVVFLPINSIYV